MNALIRATRIHDVVWAAKADDGKSDDTTPYEVSSLHIDGRSMGWFTADELGALSKFFAECEMDLREAPVIEAERARR